MKKFLLVIILVMGCMMLPTTTKAATVWFGCYLQTTGVCDSSGVCSYDYKTKPCQEVTAGSDYSLICNKFFTGQRSSNQTVGYVKGDTQPICNQRLAKETESQVPKEGLYYICKNNEGIATHFCEKFNGLFSEDKAKESIETYTCPGLTVVYYASEDLCKTFEGISSLESAKTKARETMCFCSKDPSCRSAIVNSDAEVTCPTDCIVDTSNKCATPEAVLVSNSESDAKKFAALGDIAANKLNQIGGGSLTGDTAGVSKLISMFVNFLLGILGSIALVLYIYGGFLWMTAAGNSDRVSKGVNIIIWTSLGVVVVLSSYIIVKFIFNSIKLPAAVKTTAIELIKYV